ncbi:alpha/beta hydrolase fold domain-containing protein [Nocardia sp. ET3-3]|uniref:Alpha/beta hydrolase fold domain-containing protein n=2 Tax=Nocardia terrae TaxID=2675851 RepID=A0A7K1UZM8_9NOCA|nr:alpha/beta hydrolase fold domain-containing protein [Nocardia terrae]
MPERPNLFDDLEATRRNFGALQDSMPLDTSGVDIRNLEIDGPDGNLIPISVYRPKGVAGPLPAVLHIHGGSFAFGRSRPGEDRTAIAIAEEVGAVAVSVDYRLAPEHRYPAGMEDCYTALEWIAEHAAELRVDADRVAVTGKSAGGGLTASLALLSRDRGGPAIAYQSMYIPTLDHRHDTESARLITDPRFLNNADIAQTYRHYLPEPEAETVPVYASPARVGDLSGLPPAFVLACDLDPLRDEALDYARRLMDSGIPVTVCNVPGAWHIFEFTAPDSALARNTQRKWLGDLRAALAG